MCLDKVKRYKELDEKILKWSKDKKNNPKPTEGEMFHYLKLKHELRLQTDAIYRMQHDSLPK